MRVLLISLLSCLYFTSDAFVAHRAPCVSTTTRKNKIWQSPTTKVTTLRSDLDDFANTTPLSRYRQRKVAILSKRKMINTTYLFALWYIFSIAYNIYSKNALNMAPQLAWTTATLQMSLGLSYVLPLWQSGIRDRPKLSFSEIVRLLPVAILHSLVHIGGVVSMGAGAVSFTYIVKASEPAVSAVLAALTGSILPATVYLTLLPVMSGVAIASVSELTFTWKSFKYVFSFSFCIIFFAVFAHFFVFV